jgi:hypothetical protein
MTWRALRRSSPSRRRLCPGVSVHGIRRGSRSSETNAEQATPKSTPQPGKRFGGAGLVAVATPTRCASRGRPWRSRRCAPCRRAGGTAETEPIQASAVALQPTCGSTANLNGLARKRYGQPRTLTEGGCLGGMLRVPPVVVGAVELAEHLLRALGGQVGQPRQVRAGVGEVAALLGRPDGATTLTPGESALLQCQVPHCTAGVPPAGQPFRLPRGRVGAVPPASVSVHSAQYSWCMGQDGDFATAGAASWRCTINWSS